MSKDKFSIMKTAKRVIAIVTIIILSLAIGYLAYTGSRLAGIQNEANNSTQISVVKETNNNNNTHTSVAKEVNNSTQLSVKETTINAPKSVAKEVANE
ncbi:MAG: hypothetical protein RSB09_02390 [Clostridia bacterium]